MAPHSSTLAWKIPWMEEPGGLQSMGSLRSDMTERLHFHFSLLCIGEGNGNPLQCSCLENPREGGAWWAAIYGVARSWTRLKQLSSSNSNSYVCRVYQEMEIRNETCKVGKSILKRLMFTFLEKSLCFQCERLESRQPMAGISLEH